jgi:hypothetical protein
MTRFYPEHPHPTDTSQLILDWVSGEFTPPHNDGRDKPRARQSAGKATKPPSSPNRHAVGTRRAVVP